jgi:hypothetical protein
MKQKCNIPIYVIRFCANRTGVKGNNVSKDVRHDSCDSFFEAIMIKYAEQTNNCEAARK